MTALHTAANAGRASAQTQLADYYLSVADFTNAVTWYRRAAAQDHIPAQLSLAACLMAGQGASRDPAAAARLLRRSADLIDGTSAPAGTAGLHLSTPGPARATASLGSNRPAPDPIVISRSSLTSAIASASKTIASNAVVTNGRSGTPSTAPLDASAVRLDRVTSLLLEEPALQEVRSRPGGTP